MLLTHSVAVAITPFINRAVEKWEMIGIVLMRQKLCTSGELGRMLLECIFSGSSPKSALRLDLTEPSVGHGRPCISRATLRSPPWLWASSIPAPGLVYCWRRVWVEAAHQTDHEHTSRSGSFCSSHVTSHNVTADEAVPSKEAVGEGFS